MLLCILQESRWKSSFENLDLKPGVMNIDDLVINTEMQIANGCNAEKIFPGLFQHRKVAVKRVAKHISKNEMQVAHFLCSKILKQNIFCNLLQCWKTATLPILSLLFANTI